MGEAGQTSQVEPHRSGAWKGNSRFRRAQSKHLFCLLLVSISENLLLTFCCSLIILAFQVLRRSKQQFEGMSLHLVEVSPFLRRKQALTLGCDPDAIQANNVDTKGITQESFLKI